MKERVICCCGASHWTRFIAWFKIVSNSFGIVFVSLALSQLIALRLAPSKTPEPNDGNAVSNLSSHGYMLVAAVFGVTLLNLTIGVAFGIILLRGTREKNTRLLRMWIIYAYASLVLELISSINASVLPIALFQVILTIGMYTFAIWVVGIHIEEIQTEQEVNYGPPPPYESVVGKPPYP